MDPFLHQSQPITDPLFKAYGLQLRNAGLISQNSTIRTFTAGSSIVDAQAVWANNGEYSSPASLAWSQTLADVYHSLGSQLSRSTPTSDTVVALLVPHISLGLLFACDKTS
jgi:hypothetical protein